MIESIYNFCFFYSFGLLNIVKMQIDDILILTNNNFLNIEKNAIKSAKKMIKDKKHFLLIYSLKCNSV